MRRDTASGAALGVVLLLALFADGLMDKLGPPGFLAAGAGALALAWGLVRTGERSGK